MGNCLLSAFGDGEGEKTVLFPRWPLNISFRSVNLGVFGFQTIASQGATSKNKPSCVHTSPPRSVILSFCLPACSTGGHRTMHLLPSRAVTAFHVHKLYGPWACICGSVLGDGQDGKMVLFLCSEERTPLQSWWSQSFNLNAPQKKQAALKSKQVFFIWPTTKQFQLMKGSPVLHLTSLQSWPVFARVDNTGKVPGKEPPSPWAIEFCTHLGEARICGPQRQAARKRCAVRSG